MTNRRQPLPDAIDALEVIRARVGSRRLALFLDYDGTLAAIAPTPAKAMLTASMRDILRRLARRWPVAVISGRDRADVEAMVGLADLTYAGAHGFDIAGGALGERRHNIGAEFAPVLETVRTRLAETIGGLDGVLIEAKRASVAVHYRLVAAAEVPRVERAVREAIADVNGLRLMAGKKVLEIQPAIDWHKGRALVWMIDALGLHDGGTLVLYIGDDVTDEDAFRALRDRGTGIGIRVAGTDAVGGDTAAHYRLADTAAVERFLAALAGSAD